MNETTRARFEAWILAELAAPAECWICESWGFTTEATSPAGERPTCDACHETPLPLTSGAPLVKGDSFAWGMSK